MIPVPFLLSAAVLGLYSAGLRRYNRRHPSRPFPPVRAAAFAMGAAAGAAALGPPLDPLSAWFLSAHMAQHLLLMVIAAPLLLLGTPLRVARQSGVPALERLAAWLAHSRAVKVMVWPPAAWSAYAAVLVGSHFSPLYEAALEHPAVHVLEHALYLAAALLFWSPVVGLDPSPWRMGYGLRVLYVAAALPVQSLLGVAIFAARRPLYPHYAIASAVRGTPVLADQQAGGLVMWLGGGLPVIAAMLAIAAAWAAEDRRLADHLDRAGGPVSEPPPDGRTGEPWGVSAARSSRTSPTSAAVTASPPSAASHHP